METHHQHQNNIEKQIDEVFASSNSSPSHEFSFTISQNFSPTFPHNKNKSKTTTPPSNNNFHAIDLSPADDIFFHGHLLPLQFLSHFNSSSSPRSSTNSMDSFTLPIKELLSQDESTSTLHSKENDNNNNITLESNKKVEVNKSNKFVFSLFGSTKRSKGCQVIRENLENQEKQKKKSKIDVLHALKKYLRMVKPLMLFRGQRGKIGMNRKSYTYSSGSVTPRSNNNNNNKKEFLRSWRGYSAPASMRNSPTNSGLLIATNSPLPPATAASDSTMEELQAAIQAAIVHCKNSFAKEDKLNC